MHLAYVDESGNVGVPPNGSQTYTLGCVLVESRIWPDVFDGVIDYRRFLKKTFGIPVRAEIKASYLLRNNGALAPLKLSESARRGVYKGALRLFSKVGIAAFGVVIRKDVVVARGLNVDPRLVAWEYLLQRLERFTTKGGTEVAIFHDEGDAGLVRALTRKARRAGTAGSAFGTGSLRRPARLVLDDPVPRNSQHSYFIQFADLVAYAAFRRVCPPPPKTAQIVPLTTWDELGNARYAPVNQVRGGPSGIVGGGR